MAYSCECCAYKCLYPKDLEKHNLTNKHQKNMNRQDIKCEGCLQKDVLIGRLQQENNEWKLKYDSLVDKIVLQNFQPAVQTPVQSKIKHVKQVKSESGSQSESEPESYPEVPERWNEKWLNDNFDTTIQEFVDQVDFDKDEVVQLLQNPDSFDSLVLKTLQEAVESTDIKRRGIITADFNRKKIWVLRKPNHWGVDKKATFYIKDKLRTKVTDILEQFIEENAEVKTTCPHTSKEADHTWGKYICEGCKRMGGKNEKHVAIFSELLVTMAQTSIKWEKGIDDKIMEMFEDS
jgi:hypothetical protein